MMKRLMSLLVLIMVSMPVMVQRAQAQPLSPISPFLKLEKEIIFHPDQLLKEVDKRWEELNYSSISPDLASRVETRLQLQALCLDLQDLLSKHPDAVITDDQIEKTWIKDGPIAFISSLYYWLHSGVNPAPEGGVGDAWYLVSTHVVGFQRSVHSLFKHKEKE